MELAGGSTISLWTVVAAVQALERSVAAHASRLFSLEHRAGNSEKKHLDCEKMVGEFGNQLESKCAALGTLIQDYGRLQRRLENMENLLKNRNLWILRLPPGAEVPKAPAVAVENDGAQEWENLEEWQKELYGKVLTGRREALVLLDDVISEPALLSRLQGGEEPCAEEEAAPGEIPAEPEALVFELNVSSWDSRESQENQEGRAGLAERARADCSTAEPSFAVTVKQEEEEEQGAMEGVELPELAVGSDTTQTPADGGTRPGTRSCEERDVRGNPAETGTGDSIIQIKQEEELCTANLEEEEAAEAPGEPCPAERGFHQPETSSQSRKGSEVDARELPGTEGEELQRHPDTGFQPYAMGVSSWIKQEEEPPCPKQQDLEKEETSADPSTDENLKRDHLADCLESKTYDSEVPARPGEGFPKDPSHGVTWDNQWNSEMMETTTSSNGNSLGGDAQYDFFSAQEKSLENQPCVYKCERNCPEQPRALQGEGEMFSGPTCERMFPLLQPHPGETGIDPGGTGMGLREMGMDPGGTGMGLREMGMGLGEKGMGLGGTGMGLGEKGMGLGGTGMGLGATGTGLGGTGMSLGGTGMGLGGTGTGLGEKGMGLGGTGMGLGEKGMGPGAAPSSCEGPRLRSSCGETPREQESLGTEEPAGNEESFPTATAGSSPCWEPAPARGSPAQQQNQGRGKSYICSDCGKNFVCHSWLVRHQTSHTGERPYKCSKCDKTYRRKDYLLNHQRRHTGERLFQCPLCSKRFVLKRSLLKHQEGHVQDTHVPLVSWPCRDIRGSVMHSI